MIFTICSDILIVKLDSVGAQLISVVFDGKERLWQNDNGSWTSHAPTLFPVCGRVSALVDGKPIDLPQHGVVRHKEFVGTQPDAATVVLTTSSNELTREHYPFDWRYTLTFRVDGDTMYITHEVVNIGKQTMYFALGGHESFVLQNDVGNYYVRLPQDNVLVGLLHDNNARLSGETRTFGEGGVIHLPADFLDGSTMVFGNIKSREAILCAEDGTELAITRFDGFSNFMLWRPREAHMICLEPWLNMLDSADNPTTELKDKQGFVALSAGETKVYNRSVQYKAFK